jgi:putative DNA methylase
MSEHPVKRRKKLIEVAIPLEAINAASAREKSIRHGHPSTLHLWWSRKPTATARAVIFCQMVDDPSSVPEEFPSEEAQEHERLRLFALISELVLWENTTNQKILEQAREEVHRSWRRCCADNADHPEAAKLFNPERLPGFHDPFAGGGALPLEAQRLGLEASASDLNPVAVLINKAMIEIPPKFAGRPPVNPDALNKTELIRREWNGAEGLADDVRYYGKWMREEAERRIGHLYPKLKLNPEDTEGRPELKPYIGEELKVIAWLWTRTVKSPSPSFSSSHVPLSSTFVLSSRPGKECYVEPIINNDEYKFHVRLGKDSGFNQAKTGTQLSRGANFKCILSGTPITGDYIKSEGVAGRIRVRMIAIVVEGKRGRFYLPPTEEMESIARSAKPAWTPETFISGTTQYLGVKPYGMNCFGDLFLDRQLVALNTFADLVNEAARRAENDYVHFHGSDDMRPLHENGVGAKGYADAIAVYLGMSISKLADAQTSLCRWKPSMDQSIGTFGRQALPMSWDFSEANALGGMAGDPLTSLNNMMRVLDSLPASTNSVAIQQDAQTQAISVGKVVSTDPPYYDNIPYADLSDFFYIWLRRSLKDVFPGLFATVASPKVEELISAPQRHGGKNSAEEFFLNGMTDAMKAISSSSHPAFPVSIYYAFKQSESRDSLGTASTGWETFLEAVIRAGFTLQGTWPIRTEMANRMRSLESNALATSIALICSKQSPAAPVISRSEFRRRLRHSLTATLKNLEKASIAPVDLAQAAIGPGMAIFTSVKAVLNPDDHRMNVREALIEINSALDEYLTQNEGELDPDSRFALTFFESFGYAERDFGDAEGLAKARNISVEGVSKAGILQSIAGKAWLLRRDQLNDDWDPSRDSRLCVWEATQHLIKRLEADGECSAAELLGQLRNVTGHGDLPANCRALAYRLYSHCERTKQTEEARAYNGLVIAWPELERLASSQSAQTAVQASLI